MVWETMFQLEGKHNAHLRGERVSANEQSINTVEIVKTKVIPVLVRPRSQAQRLVSDHQQ